MERDYESCGSVDVDARPGPLRSLKAQSAEKEEAAGTLRSE